MPCLRPRFILNPRYDTKRSSKAAASLLAFRTSVCDPKAYPDDYFIPVPCGRCAECLKNLVSSWRVRLLLEQMYGNHHSCTCVHLTIDPEHYEVFKDQRKRPRLFRDFLDRLRYYRRDRSTPRHFFISELGEKTHRLHFHGVIWDFPELDHATLARTWKYGFVGIRDLRNYRQLSYLTKYITKGGARHRPSIIASPGIGKAYAESESAQLAHKRPDGGCPFTTSVSFGPARYSLPRYLRSKIFSPAEIAAIQKSFPKDLRSEDLVLLRRTYSDPRQFADARKEILQRSIRLGSSLELAKRPDITRFETDWDSPNEFNNF